jgi:hypothetical protein
MNELVRVPVVLPAWVMTVLRVRSERSGRSLGDEAVVVLTRALPALVADAVADRLAEPSVSPSMNDDPRLLAPGAVRESISPSSLSVIIPQRYIARTDHRGSD